jgi:PIN domain nuclease of toxin-antitoxin system
MPSINISEVDSILLDSEMKTQQVSKAIEPFIDSIIAFDFEYSILCAALKKRYQTFSFISWG